MDERARIRPDRYPLSGPLPDEVANRARSWITSYRRYPVFSTPWFWRRTALFGAGAIAIGLAQAGLTWQFVDRNAATIITISALAIWLIIVSAGPALATLV